MKSIIIIGTLIGILFSHSGIAMMDVLGDIDIDIRGMSLTFVKMFDSGTNVVCYMIDNNTNEIAMDCLKRSIDKDPKVHMIKSGSFHILGAQGITKVFDSPERIMCYIIPGISRNSKKTTTLLECVNI